MDNQTAQKIKDAIAKSQNIGIVVGADPSLDQMAAALSLSLFLRQANKSAAVACPTDPIVEISNLVGINKVQRTLGGEAGDLVVSFPYVEGEIEKVSYTLEEGFLNIIVKAGEQGLSFDESDVRYTRGSGLVDLLFVIGTPRLADLGDVYDAEKLRDTSIINIDNNPDNQGFGDIVLVSPKLSSVSELIADIALTLGFQFDQDTAQNLMSGITTATRNFQNPNTSSLAFEMASLLMKRGASRGRPSQNDDRRERPQQQQRQQQQQQQQREQRPQQQQQQRQQPQQQQQRQQDRLANDDDDERRRQELQNQLRNQQQQNGRNDQDDEEQDDNAPLDWLTPKVYKGSSNF